MSSRVTASDRFRRIVSIVPWIARRQGVAISEICTRFDISRDDLLADLDVIFMVGIPPYTPDELIDVLIEDERVWITLGRYFTRPLRLTAQEGLSLLAAGEGLLAISGSEADGPLARALDKVRRTLGVDTADALEVSLGAAAPEVLGVARSAAAECRRLEIDYYTYGTDERRTRTVDPYRVYATEGNWYLLGWCHHAQAERIFRIDRIESAVLLDETFEAPIGAPVPEAYSNTSDRRVTLELEPPARWIIDHYPVEAVEDLPDGRARVTLAVGGDAWLERLLLRLGRSAAVVADAAEGSVTPQISSELMADVVGRMLAIYGDS